MKKWGTVGAAVQVLGESMIASVIYAEHITYPSSEDYFSPDEAWPEYPFSHLSKRPNPVYAAVRTCLADAGLDQANFGKATWNPLSQYVRPGNKVFLLCNFVEQKYRGMQDDEFFAKCTHGSVIRAVIDYVLIALSFKGSISFGNASIQSCNWDQVVEQTGASRVQEFFSSVHQGEVTVRLLDLRHQVVRRNAWGGSTTKSDHSIGSCVNVDMGSRSLLDGFFAGSKRPRLRVLDYDPRRTSICHEKGKHIYLMSPEIIGSDVIISVPKLKTHEKVGITCGIKGCVGAVAEKDCLAHHRYGPPKCGGDEYPNSLSALRVVSAIHDVAYTTDCKKLGKILIWLNSFLRKLIRRLTRSLSGSWSGNDTCWRMAIDLVRIVEYSDKNGVMQTDKQRGHIMLTDGIIAGEGDGPLVPRPVPMGYVSFSDDVAIGDYINATAMGFCPEDFPIIRVL